MYMSLSIITKATPLSAVGTIQLSSFLRLCRAFLSSLVMMDNMGFGLAVNCEDILDFGIVFNTVSFSKEVVFSNSVTDRFSGSDVLNYGSRGWGKGKFWNRDYSALVKGLLQRL